MKAKSQVKMLEDFGFKLAGQVLAGCELKDVKFLFGEEAKSIVDVVYVYVVDGQVEYVGETSLSCAGRARSHWTNIAKFSEQGVRKGSTERWADWAERTPVADIYFKPAATITVFGKKVSARTSEESALIEIFQPWVNQK